MNLNDSNLPIKTTTVGSYPVPDWLSAHPDEQALRDATRVVFDIQRQAGIDLPTDGELYRFDVNHPDANGMIDYFVSAMSGIRTQIGRRDWIEFRKNKVLSFRQKPAGVVEGALGEGSLNLLADCERAAFIANGPFKFTLTSPYMLARTLIDSYYGDFEALVIAIAEILAEQVFDLPCTCIQIDEANLPGQPTAGLLTAKAINLVLDRVACKKAVHLCFGNYGGQTIQIGTWKKLVDFFNHLHCDHLILELANRPEKDLAALKDVEPRIAIGIGVIDVKINHIETPDKIAQRIEAAVQLLGKDRIKWVHPDCGFWMLKRSIVDRKIEALVKGRNKYLGIN